MLIRREMAPRCPCAPSDGHSPHPPNRTRKRLLLAGGGLVVIAAATIGLARLEPAAPQVERGTLWIDAVTRGPFVREVRGNGTLVPEDIRWIPARSEGRVERVVILPGAVVGPDSVILEMTNPELEVQAQDADLALAASEADLRALEVQLDHNMLDQEAQAAQVNANFQQTQLEAERDVELNKEGLVSNLQAKISQVRAEEATTRKALEERRLKSAEAANVAQLAAQKARVEQTRSVAALRRQQLDPLRVRAGMTRAC